MTLIELIDVLNQLSLNNPELRDKQLFFVDRDNCPCSVENVQILYDSKHDDVHLDLGGQYGPPVYEPRQAAYEEAMDKLKGCKGLSEGLSDEIIENLRSYEGPIVIGTSEKL